MSIVINQETKLNSIALTLESKSRGETWADMTTQWGQNDGTWGVPGVTLIKETKLNTTSLILETKL